MATGSGAILLDGAFNLCFFATALVTLKVAKLLGQPDDRRYPFGYVQFEPLINMVKGLLIVGVGLVALIDAAFSIYVAAMSWQRAWPLSMPRLRSWSVALPCCFCAAPAPGSQARSSMATSRTGRSISPSRSGMLAAFCLALFLQGRGMGAAARLVDPILVGLVVILTLGVPIRMAGRGLLALLNRAPDQAVVASVEALVIGALTGLSAPTLYVRVLQPGRTTYVLVHVLLGQPDLGLDVRRADQLRRAVIAAIATRHAPVIVDIIFTAVEELAAPTTGFVGAEPHGMGGHDAAGAVDRLAKNRSKGVPIASRPHGFRLGAMA